MYLDPAQQAVTAPLASCEPGLLVSHLDSVDGVYDRSVLECRHCHPCPRQAHSVSPTFLLSGQGIATAEAVSTYTTARNGGPQIEKASLRWSSLTTSIGQGSSPVVASTLAICSTRLSRPR